MSCVLYCRLVAARPNAATKSSDRLFLISRPIPSIPFHCRPSAGKEHRAVMLQHLETIQVDRERAGRRGLRVGKRA